MEDFPRATDSVVVRGAKAGDGPGYTLEAIAVRISQEITRVREHGGLPAGTRTVVTVLQRQQTLHIRVEGFGSLATGRPHPLRTSGRLAVPA